MEKAGLEKALEDLFQYHSQSDQENTEIIIQQIEQILTEYIKVEEDETQAEEPKEIWIDLYN